MSESKTHSVFDFLIAVYRTFFRSLFGNACKFHPSCSEYARSAVHQRGLFVGLCLSFFRILRCNPFSKGGYDPVPLVEACCERK